MLFCDFLFLSSLDCAIEFIINENKNDDNTTIDDFEIARKKYGSVIAYHGSPTCNWHPILQNGLQNMSHTKLSTSGSLFGEGIYLSSNLAVCKNFTKVMFMFMLCLLHEICV